MTFVLVGEVPGVELESLVGRFVYASWPCEVDEEVPIYFRGKAVPTLTCLASRDGERVCVGIGAGASLLSPTALCSVRVVTEGTCAVLREEFEAFRGGGPLVTGENVVLGNGLAIVVLVVDERSLLVHVSRS